MQFIKMARKNIIAIKTIIIDWASKKLTDRNIGDMWMYVYVFFCIFFTRSRVVVCHLFPKYNFVSFLTLFIIFLFSFGDSMLWCWCCYTFSHYRWCCFCHNYCLHPSTSIAQLLNWLVSSSLHFHINFYLMINIVFSMQHGMGSSINNNKNDIRSRTYRSYTYVWCYHHI